MQHTIQHLFQVNSLEEVSRERLEELVTNYPSFSVGRYLLSRKLHVEQDGHFSEETQKTNLYFSNPFWLQWLLQNEEPVSGRTVRPDEPRSGGKVSAPADLRSGAAVEAKAEDLQPEAQTETLTEAHRSEAALEARPDHESATAVGAPLNDGEEGNGIEPASGEIFFQEKLTDSEEEAPSNPVEPALEATAAPTETEDTIDPRVKELLEAVRGEHRENREVRTENDEAPATVEGETRVAGSGLEEQAEGKTSIPVQVEEPGVEAELKAAKRSSAPPTAAETLLQQLAEARGLRQALVKMNEEEPSVAGTSENGVPVLTGADTEAQQGEGIGVDNGAKEQTGANVGTQQAAGAESGAQTGGQMPEQEPSTAIVAHAIALAEPVVEFEPYHTIDYFASVGIKFVQEENPSDKLGKQLKSFTDWLKVMRKLPQKNQEIVPDMAVEHQIQAIAAHSIKGKDVVTETMAEVLVKQGMREKAVEVYHKLSLLNPDKSAYFAAKIEQLKID